MTDKEMNRMLEAVLDGPCYVVDLLPQRVEEGDPVRFFEQAEQHFLNGKELGKTAKAFSHIIIKTLCYFEFRVYEDRWSKKVSCEELDRRVKKIVKNRQGYLTIFLPGEMAAIQITGGVLNLSVYQPSARMTGIMSKLAHSEGLFWWKGNDGAETMPRTQWGPESSNGKSVRRAGKQELDVLAELAVMMWTDHTAEDLKEEFEEIMDGKTSAFFICRNGGNPIGFAQCQLRNDYVEGTEGSPVGYLEDIFVKEGYRNQGCARELLKECEAWARKAGCREFASDCGLTNEASLKFHLGVGFEEANRIICFTKLL